MRNSLTPEQRTDKNGVTSTRWVKQVAPVSDALSQLPPPSLNSRRIAAEFLTDEVHNIVFGNDEKNDEARLRINDYLLGHTDQTLEAIQEFLNFYSVSQNYYGSKTHIVASAIERGESQGLVSDLITYLEWADEYSIRTLRLYRERDGVTDETPHGTPDSRVIALMQTTRVVIDTPYGGTVPEGSPVEEVVGDGGEYYYILKDSRVTNLVLDHPNDNELINRIIRERKTVDYGAIHAAVEGAAKSLSSGIL
jgi:hypothetical protein